MADTVEGPLLRVPFESLKRTTRERKYLLEELDTTLDSLRQQTGAGPLADRDGCIASLDSLLVQLQGIKRKLDDISRIEAEDATRCNARLQHLAALGVPAKEHSVAWNRPRLDRILVDYMLRNGYHASAASLTASSGLQDLVDAHVFAAAWPVVAALRSRNCGPALMWCAEQRTRLRKARSSLEFRLRVQEFIELVRCERRVDAIAYARQHLAGWAGSHLAELQRAMAALAFAPATRCRPYQQLFDDEQWDVLVGLFLKELYRLHSMTQPSLLEIHMQAGLSALKVPQSYEKGASKEDPLARPTFQRLAQGLPFAKHVHSKLICGVTKEVMNEHNPPMVLPDGSVVSEKAVKAITERHGGRYVDPHTAARYEVSEIRRAYIS